MKKFFKILLKNNKNITPSLFIYKSQYTSIFSIFMRISGFFILFYIILILINNNNIFFNFNSYNFIYELFRQLIENNFISYLLLYFLLIFFNYHFFFGIRYILSSNFFGNFKFNNFLNLDNFYKISFLFLFLIFLSLIFIINLI